MLDEYRVVWVSKRQWTVVYIHIIHICTQGNFFKYTEISNYKIACVWVWSTMSDMQMRKYALCVCDSTDYWSLCNMYSLRKQQQQNWSSFCSLTVLTVLCFLARIFLPLSVWMCDFSSLMRAGLLYRICDAYIQCIFSHCICSR